MAAALLDETPVVDRLVRARLVERVQRDWTGWRSRTGGQPEQYLADLLGASNESALDGRFLDAQRYVALVIASHMGRLKEVGGRLQLIGHYVHRAAPAVHQEFWRALFDGAELEAVVTTNYDVLAERGLGLNATRRRPGFHYGSGSVELEGGGYPSFSHLRAVRAEGRVPLLKLHGSASWSLDGSVIRFFRDCRPALKQEAAILAPVQAKQVPTALVPTWRLAAQHLQAATHWLIVGYSMPAYDQAMQDLLKANHRGQSVYVADPSPFAAQRLQALLGTDVQRLPGLPAASRLLGDVLDA